MVSWTVDYFSKFEFTIRRGSVPIAILLCDVVNGELSYQEWRNTKTISYEYATKLIEKQVNKLLPYIKIVDFVKCRQHKWDFSDPKVVGYRDEMSITFRGISQDGQPMLIYDMAVLYKDWYNWPVDKLYDYLSKEYFSGKKESSCYIASGLMSSVCPM